MTYQLLALVIIFVVTLIGAYGLYWLFCGIGDMILRRKEQRLKKREMEIQMQIEKYKALNYKTK